MQVYIIRIWSCKSGMLAFINRADVSPKISVCVSDLLVTGIEKASGYSVSIIGIHLPLIQLPQSPSVSQLSVVAHHSTVDTPPVSIHWLYSSPPNKNGKTQLAPPPVPPVVWTGKQAMKSHSESDTCRKAFFFTDLLAGGQIELIRFLTKSHHFRSNGHPVVEINGFLIFNKKVITSSQRASLLVVELSCNMIFNKKVITSGQRSSLLVVELSCYIYKYVSRGDK